MKRKTLYFLALLLFSCERVNDFNESDRITQKPGDADLYLKSMNFTCYTRASANYIVTDVNSLIYLIGTESVIGSADDNAIIYLDDNVTFDLTTQYPLVVRKKLIIASGRGQGTLQGALIKIATGNPSLPLDNSIFKVVSGDVSINGIRLLGPKDHDYRWSIECGTTPYSDPQLTTAIACFSSANLVVENCDISGFSYSGVHIKNSMNARINNNYIHDTRNCDVAYGVLLNDSNTSAIISNNIFYANRHDIAGTGHRTQSYEACFNLIKANDGGNSQHFDMHGEGEGKKPIVENSCFAGYDIKIHDNIFEDSRRVSIKIRGNPANIGLIENNKFATSSLTWAVSQPVISGCTPGNLTIRNNLYGYTPPPTGIINDVLLITPNGDLNKFLFSTGLYFNQTPAVVAQNWNVYTHCFVADWNGNGTSDIVVRDNSAHMLFFPFNNGTFIGQGGPITVGHNWNFTDYFALDWNGNGTADLLVRDNSGNMILYPFRNNTFYGQGGPITVASGWYYTHYFAGNWTGDGSPDMIVRNSAGNMILFPYRNGTFVGQGGPVTVGSGWNFTHYFVGDFTGDGISDMMVRDNAARMVLYPFKNNSFYGQGGPIVVASNWNYADYFSGDFTGDGIPDIIVKDNLNSMYLFEFDKITRVFKAPVLIGTDMVYSNFFTGKLN